MHKNSCESIDLNRLCELAAVDLCTVKEASWRERLDRVLDFIAELDELGEVSVKDSDRARKNPEPLSLKTLRPDSVQENEGMRLTRTFHQKESARQDDVLSGDVRTVDGSFSASQEAYFFSVPRAIRES